MQAKTISIDQAKSLQLQPSKHSIEIYAQLKLDYAKGKATEIAFGSKNQWNRLKNDVIDLADADGLLIYVQKTDDEKIRKFWLELK